MKNEEIIKKLKEELPDFDWTEQKDGTIETSVACATFIAGIGYSNSDFELDFSVDVKRKVLSYLEEKNLLSDVDEFENKLGLDKNNKYSDDPIPFNTIDENFLDLVIKGLKIWKDELDKLRKGDTDEDQLIIIHPDWDLKGFEKDFKFITKEPDSCFDPRLGVMSTKDWDFGKEELRDELQYNSCDCFCIWPYDEDDDSIDDDELKDAKNELQQIYPDLSKFTKIYNTDFD